jgi:hypothetical protein
MPTSPDCGHAGAAGAVWLMSFQIAARPAPAARAWRNLARRGIEEMR